MRSLANVIWGTVLILILALIGNLLGRFHVLEDIQPNRFVNITGWYTISNINWTGDIQLDNIPLVCYERPSSTECLMKIENVNTLTIHNKKIRDVLIFN